MKKTFNKISLIITILIIGGFILFPNTTHAAGWLDGPIKNVINSGIANVGDFLLSATGVFVTICGTFLSISINLTTHIGDFFNSIPALSDVWIVIRNLSSIFIIFILLYTSILTILGMSSSSNTKDLIRQIIIAGLLINFSLFFTKVLIDASNLVSLQFYRAIAPNASENFDTKSVFNNGGLSNVFMDSLKIQTIYNNSKITQSLDVAASIGIATIAGIILMITVSFSLLAASVAFMARTAILLFVMAASPVYFVAMIFPQLKKHAGELFDTFKAQLLFMPIYLFLMYVALTLITSPGFNAIFNQKGVAAAGDPTFGPAFLSVIIQSLIALFFINIPLVAAIKFGAMGAKWAPDVNAVANWFGTKTKKIGSSAWRNTGGAIASKVADSEGAKNLASKSIFAAGALRGIRGVAASYNETAKKKGEERAKFGESLGYNKTNAASLENSIAAMKKRVDTENLIINDPNSTTSQITAAKSQIATYKGHIKTASNRLSEIKRERQVAYTGRLDPRTIDPATGKLKRTSLSQWITRPFITRGAEIGAAQINIKNTEAEITQLKSSLDDKKKELSIVKDDIKRLEGVQRSRQLTPNEITKMGELKNDLYAALSSVQTTTEEISTKEREVKRYKA